MTMRNLLIITLVLLLQSFSSFGTEKKKVILENIDCETFKNNLNVTEGPYNFKDDDGRLFLKAPEQRLKATRWD